MKLSYFEKWTFYCRIVKLFRSVGQELWSIKIEFTKYLKQNCFNQRMDRTQAGVNSSSKPNYIISYNVQPSPCSNFALKTQTESQAATACLKQNVHQTTFTLKQLTKLNYLLLHFTTQLLQIYTFYAQLSHMSNQPNLLESTSLPCLAQPSMATHSTN